MRAIEHGENCDDTDLDVWCDWCIQNLRDDAGHQQAAEERDQL